MCPAELAEEIGLGPKYSYSYVGQGGGVVLDEQNKGIYQIFIFWASPFRIMKIAKPAPNLELYIAVMCHDKPLPGE